MATYHVWDSSNQRPNLPLLNSASSASQKKDSIRLESHMKKSCSAQAHGFFYYIFVLSEGKAISEWGAQIALRNT